MFPIERVVLFKHGVGYFQRVGKVRGNQTIELSFKASQMNDVLKSLTALDYSGGSFAALSYDSEEPIERRLAELNVSIPEGGAITQFLDRVKGALVEVPLGDGIVRGRIVGIEEVERTERESLVKDAHLALLVGDERLVRVPLLDVSELKLLDESLQSDLKSLLSILYTGLRKDRKCLSIQAVGEGERVVSLGYVVEAPVWKVSYRVVLPTEAYERPILQGWALVDNTTDDDWTGVSLSLASGLPISFVHDLYTPRHRARPTVEANKKAAVGPPVVESGHSVPAAPPPPRAPVTPVPPKRSRGGSTRPPPRPSAPAPATTRPSVTDSVPVHARTEEVGDLFTYEITHPVDIARSRSALVPILQAEAELSRVVLYNPAVRADNPMTAFRFKNNTGLTLEGGPVTVFEGGTYVGEAMLDTVRQGEERFTPYSVELGIQVKKTAKHEREQFRRVTKHGHYLYQYYRELVVTTYNFDSHLDRVSTAYVDHEFTYDIREGTPDPVEVTEHFWRFRFEVRPQAVTQFVVREVREQYEALEIRKIARASIHQLAALDLIDDRLRHALEQIATQVESMESIRQQLRSKAEQANQIEQGQHRVRENLRSLTDAGDEKKLRQRYVASLTNEEEQLDAIRADQANLKESLEAFRERIEVMIAKLDFM